MLLYLFLTLTNHLDHSQEQNFLDSCLLSVGELKKMGGRDKIMVLKMKQKGIHFGLKKDKIEENVWPSMLQSCTATSSHHQASHDQTDIESDYFAHSLVLEQGGNNRDRNYTFSYHTTLPISFNNVLQRVVYPNIIMACLSTICKEILPSKN